MRASTLILITALAAGCEDQQDTPEAAAHKAECRQLEAHIFEITPRPGATTGETDPQRIAALVARLPIEDIEQCAAIQDRRVIACMQRAPDPAALRACIPAKQD